MSRAVGQHKTPIERARDQAEAQAAAVAKMHEKLAVVQDKLDEVRQQEQELMEQIKLENELLSYYQAHPLLQRQQAEPMLPLDEDVQPTEVIFKGIKGRAVLQ